MTADRQTGSAHRDNPGVRFPPPLIFVGAIAAGLLLNRLAPMAVLPSSGHGLRRTIGWVLVAGSLGLAASAMLMFVRAKTSILPIRPTTTLVAHGPYRFTRNPMYLSMSLLTTGVGLLTNALWVLVALAVAILVTSRFVIGPEERYLESKFGGDYERYKARVRRWF